MLATQRQHLILQELDSEGTVRVAALADLLRVSEMTVRRDIDALDAEGLLLRVHGGATRAAASSALEPGFGAKSAREADAKRAIAEEALTLLRPGMTLLVSGGTTTHELARLLPRDLGLTVATNSLMVANALAAAGDGGIRTVILGGQRTPSEALVGPVAVHALDNLHADVCFMGVHGFDPKAGITSPNLLESEVNAAMITASDQLAVLADATKYGTVGLAGIAPLSAVGTLITDDRISTGSAGPAAEELLRQSVGELRLARLTAAPASQLGSSSGRSQGWERPELLPTPHNDPLPAQPTSLPDGQTPATAFKGNDA
ncbi:DeoR/GlpR family transcriptional regulator of sugar metabolism [Arthrobacter globiformis]|uniref:DeoR/GlpR family DNA-binding transcription regulator n=1 Tax=Arthrobacter globiformis TaxID=1665 RepID=UPI00278A6621|nr:DeoR/GlpR family DNA-binding transcription regulator [Arthrobacter globiformis]MDQ1057543.1 DeoR/GlpR family transcriptional regulator of sugar metabolism [Arthrobacter globiformis]